MIYENGRYYLYRHIRLDKNEPFYIGIGRKHRKKSPYYRAFQTTYRNNIWNGIYNKTKIEVEILIESDDAKFISEKEKEFISLYGRICSKDGILANLDFGGYKDIPLKRSKDNTQAVKQCMAMAKNMIGKNHFYKLAVSGCAYNLDGTFAFSFRSGIEAQNIIGGDAKSYVILKRLDKNRSYYNFYFSKIKTEYIDVTGFKVEPIGKDYGVKKVLKVDEYGNVLQEFNTLKEAAKTIGMHKDSLAVSIRESRKTRKGLFKYVDK